MNLLLSILPNWVDGKQPIPLLNHKQEKRKPHEIFLRALEAAVPPDPLDPLKLWVN